MADEQQIRSLARELKDEYETLEVLKTARTKPPEVRVMRPRPGPQAPGNWLMVSTGIDCEQRLREVALNAMGDLQIKLYDGDLKPDRLCSLLSFHAQAVSELAWANDLADELAKQIHTIQTRTIGNDTTPTRLLKRARSHDQLYRAAHAAKIASAATGHKINRKQITYWGNAGHIQTHTDNHGHTCYKLNDIINHLKTTLTSTNPQTLA